MNTADQIKAIEEKVNDVISGDPGCFLVEATIKSGNNIKVYIDGDQGIGIDQLVKYNRSLYKKIEESGLFPEGDFSLEVSSPGLDEPLKMHRQYVKNIGRHVEVITKDGLKKEGKLTAVAENEILLEEEKGKGKKKETVQHSIAADMIKSTKIQIKF